MWESRAVARYIEPGVDDDCAGCGEQIRFNARARKEVRVIANVYVEGLWARVEVYHGACYEHAGRPHGPAELRKMEYR